MVSVMPKRQRDESPSPPPLKRRTVVESTTTKKAVSNFFTPASKKEPDPISWRVVNDTVLFARYKPKPTNESNVPTIKKLKIAAFDLDSTLIQTSSGNIWGRDANDWRWWHPTVPGELRRLNADGFNIAILTNQGSISLAANPKTVAADAKSLTVFKTKVTAILSHFEFPILLLAATARDVYRKPRSGMWTELREELDLVDDQTFNLDASVFVGDAGGRPGDHACSDRDFAANVGVDFKTPEEFFLHEPSSAFSRLFEPRDALNSVLKSQPNQFEKPTKVDLVILVGSPGSGKSTFYWTELKSLGYERVNQDTLKSRDKCVKVAKSFLDEGKSVAVDNTNADVDTRAVWINLATKYKVPIRCIYFTAPAKLCEHNDTVRALAIQGFNPEKRSILPYAAFAGFSSRLKEPKLNEGFHDIMKVDFEVFSPGRGCVALTLPSHPEGYSLLIRETDTVSRDRRAENSMEQILDLRSEWCQHFSQDRQEMFTLPSHPLLLMT